MNGGIELAISVNRKTAEEALRLLNWYFDEHADQYLIQNPRTVYDSGGSPRTTVRYLIKQREQETEKRGSNHESGII